MINSLLGPVFICVGAGPTLFQIMVFPTKTVEVLKAAKPGPKLIASFFHKRQKWVYQHQLTQIGQMVKRRFDQ